MTRSSIEPKAAVAAAAGASPKAGQRLVALDAFRGAVMALMVIVNNAGSERDSYVQLRHAEWNGWTITDTVFPSFLWIVGVAITLSLGRRMGDGTSKPKLLRKVFRRSLILFALGLLIYALPDFNLSTQRIMGVLQRIAICYLVASAIFLSSGVRAQILWICGLMAAYWMLMTLVPTPGYGPGRLDVEGNFAHYVDRLLLGRHNYAPTKTWDPEGFVSTLPAIATTLFGVMAGRILRIRRSLPERIAWLFFAGNLLLVAGLIATAWMPINKKIWTDSFCLFMAGLDFVAFAILAWLIDWLGWQKPARPFVILGMNAIAIYLASEFAAGLLDAANAHRFLYQKLFASLASPANASLLYSLAYTGLMFLLALVLYRRRWFLRV
jgi:predicted acyltransferase